ncbi:11638_t:CDS:1, partial [Racocetra persica]
EEYYFEHISLDWINIPIRPNEIYEIKTNKKPMIPTSLVQLQEVLENITDEIYINVLIKQQKEINPTITILRQYFEIPQISDYILEPPPLPELTWDIFA